ncbi:TNF receptor-associated factor 3 isoform 1 [Reticulomyxa filosa]|uniref:TNF receptor-associated factor 3 isoform 1 n=1 Tax=Reticulomyxa filosa TaxID=46433 RepID=X6P0Z6_RETFI|nr:TNF receptor-associated factor 3 isoform 1 [Reticulomyxa filosa]|eukprot:ETO32245.1 TNF receptor-associated factor 3 isoform 1 [Reticulomyxa filosa]
MNDLLFVKCPNTCKGCSWTDKLGSLQSHIQFQCDFQFQLCTFCQNRSILRKDIASHLAVCPDVVVPCSQICGTFFKLLFYLVNYVIILKCPCVMVTCTNHGCQEQIARGIFRRHVKHECLFRSVKCSFAKYGCNIGRIAYSDLLKHDKEFETQHLRLQIAYYDSKIDILGQVGISFFCVIEYYKFNLYYFFCFQLFFTLNLSIFFLSQYLFSKKNSLQLNRNENTKYKKVKYSQIQILSRLNLDKFYPFTDYDRYILLNGEILFFG